MPDGDAELAEKSAKIKDCIAWMQSLIAFIDSCCRRRAITDRPYGCFCLGFRY